MSDDEYVIVTKSLADVEDFKYNLDRKRRVFEKLVKNPLLLAVIVYVRNPNIYDIKKTVYLVPKFFDIDKLLETVKNYLDFEDETIKYYLSVESEEGNIVGDLLLEEAWEYFHNNEVNALEKSA
jgi:hypothetical protein